jgi:hypothetical protein
MQRGQSCVLGTPAIYWCAPGGLFAAHTSAATGGPTMMNDGWIWGMGFGHLVGLVLIALIVAALIKYVFFR